MFSPTIWLKNVFEIDGEFLSRNAVEGLILDLDNTLSMHGDPAAEEGVFEWLGEMRGLNIKMAVVSNNTAKRVTPLASELGLDFIPFGCKPLTFGLNRAVKMLGLPKNRIAVVGDQIFTDIIGGNMAGMRTILVEPFHIEKGLFFKMKRHFENLVYKRDYSRLKSKGE